MYGLGAQILRLLPVVELELLPNDAPPRTARTSMTVEQKNTLYVLVLNGCAPPWGARAT